jgi:DNA-binding transcriptional LysR family regulator
MRAPYLSAAKVLARSDLVTTVSRRISHSLIERYSLQVQEAPFESPVIGTSMLWHLRLDNHPAHRWLCEVVLSVRKNLSIARA